MRTLKEIADDYARLRDESRRYFERVIEPKIAACKTLDDLDDLREWMSTETDNRALNLPAEISIAYLMSVDIMQTELEDSALIGEQWRGQPAAEHRGIEAYPPGAPEVRAVGCRCNKHGLNQRCPIHGELTRPHRKCGRKACGKPGAVYWNPSTRAYYCFRCARKINEHNPDLCVLAEPIRPPVETEGTADAE